MAGVESRVVPRPARRALRRRARADRGPRPRAAARAARAQPGGALLHRVPGDRGRRARGRGLSRAGAAAHRGVRRPPGLSARAARAAARGRARGAPAPPPLRARRGRRRSRAPVRAPRALDRGGGRHRDRLRAARRSCRLVARRRAVRLLQVAAKVGDEIVCGVVDCYQVAPRPLLRLLADGREITARNARYEDPCAELALRPPRVDAGVRHELRVPGLRAPLVDPGPGLRAPRCDARHRHAPLAGRAQGRVRSRLVGRRAAACRAARLRRLRRGRTDRGARARTCAGGRVRLHGSGARGLAHGLPGGRAPATGLAPPRLDGGARADHGRGGQRRARARRRGHPPPAAPGPARAILRERYALRRAELAA